MATRKKRIRRPRGSGRIRKTGESKYSVSVVLPRATPDAKRREKYATVNGTMEDAKKRVRELQREVDKGAFDVADDMLTVNDLLDRYLQAQAISKQGTTVAWYERNFKTHVRAVIGARRLADLRASHIDALLAGAREQSRLKRNGQKRGAQTLRNVRVGIRAALLYAVKQGLVIRNVGDLSESPKEQLNERVVVGLDETQKLMTVVEGTELEAIVAFQIGTGLRRGETCGLRWGDLDLDKRTIRVQRAAANLRGEVIIKQTKTLSSRRTRPLARFVVAVLRKHRIAQAERHLALGIGKQGPESLVFDRWDGRAWDPNELSRVFTRMRQRNNLPAIRLHDCRHGFATMKYAACKDLRRFEGTRSQQHRHHGAPLRPSA